MKNIFSFLFVFSSFVLLQAQGTIIGFNLSPANPTATDTIYIYADLRFTSSACELDNISHAVTGFSIDASAHHCLGVATAICSALDTFKINPLPAGNYNFNLGLTSGGSPAPCTPGVVADDDSTFSFTVGPNGPAAVEANNKNAFTVYPNPVVNQLNFSSLTNNTAYTIIDISGKIIKSGLVTGNSINGLEILPSGLYFIKLETGAGDIVRRFAKG